MTASGCPDRCNSCVAFLYGSDGDDDATGSQFDQVLSALETKTSVSARDDVGSTRDGVLGWYKRQCLALSLNKVPELNMVETRNSMV